MPIGPGRYERDERAHVLEPRRCERADQRPHRAAFELEHADRLGPGQQRERLRVVERDVVDVGPRPGRLLDQPERDLHDVQVAQPEEVHLQQAELAHAVHLVLRDDGCFLDRHPGLGLALDREVLGERFAGDHDRGRVDAVLAAQPFEPERDVDRAPRVRVVLVELPELRRHLVAVGVLVLLLEARVQRRVPAHHERRHQLRDLVADRVRVAEHARGVAHRGPGLDGGERDDLGDVVVAVPVGGVADHLPPVPGVEVHVDVGHLLAARVEEPLEEEVVLDRVDVDDAQAVRHARTGRAAPARPDPDAARLGVADEVPDDEEVRGEPHRLDDVELEVDALAHVHREVVAVALLRAFDRQLAQVRVLVVPFGDGERREDRVPELELDRGPLGDEQRVVACFRRLAEQMAHLLRALDVELVAVELEPVRVALQRAGLHTQQRVVGLRVFLLRVVAVVGREQRRIELARDVEQRADDLGVVVDAVVLELDEEVLAPEDLLEPRRRGQRRAFVALQDELRHEPAEAARGRGDALVVRGEQLPVGAGLVVVAVEVRHARDLDQVAVALIGLGEQREVEDLVLAALRPVEARRVGEVALHAEHRLDARGARGFVQLERAVHVAVVGDADRRLPVGGGRGHDLADPRCSVEHRVLGVEMQMDE